MRLRYPLHRPMLDENEETAVTEVIRSGFLVQGRQVAAFEEAVASHLGFAHGVAVTSGTSALHVALASLMAGQTGSVIVPAFGYPATANVVELMGCRTIFADIDPETWALTEGAVAEVIREDTIGVIAVHPFGMLAPMASLSRFVGERGVWLMQDGACVLGTDCDLTEGDHPLCLSFHPRKIITTGEGGMVLTQSRDLASTMRQWRNHGVDPSRKGWDRFVGAGFNYRMTDIQGAMGRVQLGKLNEIVSIRQRVADWYRRALSHVDGLHWFTGYDRPGLSVQSMVIQLADNVDRDALIGWLRGKGVETTIAGYAIHRQPYYVHQYPGLEREFPVTDRLYDRGLTLPVTHHMVEEDVALICALVKEGIRNHG
jgi:perosamine synthetase